MSLAFESIAEIARKLRAGETSSVAITELMLERIAKYNPVLNAFITVTGEQALNEARAADRELAAGTDRGLMHGIPIAIKDLCATKGVLTTAGSKIYEDWVPNYDATVVRKLREAGAVSLGKTGLHELAYGMTSDNDFYGAVRNPWNTDYIPGGSSGGSAAAVAAGLAYGAVGTDTGCSIRQPAHCCGIVGHKPTFGLVSKAGVVPLCWSMDHVGPMTRYVDDAAIMLRAMAGYDSTDPCSIHSAPEDLDDHGPLSIEGLRLGIVRRFFFEGRPEIINAVDAAIDKLARQGAQIIELDVPDIEDGYAACRRTFVEALAVHEQHLAEQPNAFGEQVRRKLEASRKITATQYARDQHYRGGFRRTMEALFEDCDILCTPASLIGAVPIDDVPDDFARLAPRTTGISDFTGQPSISVPCGFLDDGLPVGMMLTGPLGRDAIVLTIARTVESALDSNRAPGGYA